MATLMTRQQVCDSFGLISPSQRADLMNPSITTLGLIEFLSELFEQRGGIWRGKLVCTAVHSDHPTYDSVNGHSGGNAIDISQMSSPDDAVVHLVKDIQACEMAKGIGLGGPFQAAVATCGPYGPASKLFEDNSTDHIHIQVVSY